MRVLVFGNNRLAWWVVRWLREQREELVGLVVHPSAERRYGQELIASAAIGPERIVDGSQLDRPEIVQVIRRLDPELGLSVLFGYRVPATVLTLMSKGCVNLHPALLPHNRGAHPNVWSIVEGTPAGATLHYMDASIDTGDIIAQQQVPVEPVDTGETLYRKLEQASFELFTATWPQLCAGRVARSPQPTGGTSHRKQDVERIDEVDLDRTYTARQLIDVIRARTFSPHAGAYFRDRGRKVYLRLQLLEEDQLKPPGQ